MKEKNTSDKREIENYTHLKKTRLNNPPAGLVTSSTDPHAPPNKYSYDPHLDPQLIWAGKAEHTSFEVPKVSLHVHERIDPQSIIEAVRKSDSNHFLPQLSLFGELEENLPIRQAIEFYQHKHNWSNRLVAGDNLLVMNSLLEKEGMAGQVQMIYIDPPYGIRYGSNFQPFVNKRVVKDGVDEDLSVEPEMLKAFRDTWELGIHSYLTYLRDRLRLSRLLLTQSGSCFVQISDENLHLIKSLMDEVFGKENFISLIAFKKKKMPLGETHIFTMCDYIVWFAKSKKEAKFNRLFVKRETGAESDFSYVELEDGRELTGTECIKEFGEIPKSAKIFQSMDMRSSGRTESCVFEYEFSGRNFFPSGGRSWKTNIEGLKKLDSLNRLFAPGDSLRYKYYYEDYPMMELSHVWMDTQGATNMKYVVQTPEKVVQRCMLMTTDPGDLVFDPTCGGGTTAYIAEQWGRRWITCDTSRIAISIAKQRIMTALFKYYDLAHEKEGISSGLKYNKFPHITIGSLTGEEPKKEEIIYDSPFVDSKKVRVTGPFTMEAVPAPAVKPLEEIEVESAQPEDTSVARSGETLRLDEWLEELFKTGIRGRGGERIEFTRVEPLSGTHWLHGVAETREEKPQLTMVSCGSPYAPLDQNQVELAIEEANRMVPKPSMLVFTAFQFDPEAAKDIDETQWPGVTLLKAQMNADLLTEDLKKKRASNESFWLIGQPDVRLEKVKDGPDQGKWRVAVEGFDYYNTRTGSIDSGDTTNIAMWMLDTDYDGRSVFPRQVFFPMAGDNDGWAKLAKNLKAEIDEERIEAYRGTISLPFERGEHGRVAVKIIDDRGIESLKIIHVPA